MSNVLSQIVVTEIIEILQDLAIRSCNTGASNHSTLSKVGCSVEKQSEVVSQRILEPVQKAECEVDIPCTICDHIKNKLTNVNVTEIYSITTE